MNKKVTIMYNNTIMIIIIRNHLIISNTESNPIKLIYINFILLFFYSKIKTSILHIKIKIKKLRKNIIIYNDNPKIF